jgi:hypothetical protein
MGKFGVEGLTKRDGSFRVNPAFPNRGHGSRFGDADQTNGKDRKSVSNRCEWNCVCKVGGSLLLSHNDNGARVFRRF